MEGIISHKCLGVRNVNLFSVGIEMLCHCDIFNSTKSANRTRVALTSLDLGSPAELPLHWLTRVTCSFLVLSAGWRHRCTETLAPEM